MEKLSVLAVDDDEDNLFILKKTLAKAERYDVAFAEDGLIAWNYLKEHPEVDIILLDRMMPNMDGMEVAARVRKADELKHIPIIIQSGKTGSAIHSEAIEVGAYFYLTKPFSNDDLLVTVDSASKEAFRRRKIRTLLQSAKPSDIQEFKVSTPQEAYRLAASIAVHCPKPEDAADAVLELMLNAIEHGNLGITYEEKGNLIKTGDWEAEVERRLHMPENANKTITVILEKSGEKLSATVKDQGPGFEWEPYLSFSANRILHLNGRGIAKANSVCDVLEYRDGGSEVTCSVFL